MIFTRLNYKLRTGQTQACVSEQELKTKLHGD